MKLKYTEWSDCYYTKELDIDPKAFIDIEDEDDLYDAIRETFQDSVNYGDIILSEIYEHDCEGIQRFIYEWKKLKNHDS